MLVLVVDDDAKLSSLVQRGLNEDGIDTHLAGTARDGLELAATNEYDAVVLDVLLPDMDGLELCRRLRGSGVTTFVLVTTARADLDREDVRAAGGDEHMPKPFALWELSDRLKRR